MQSTETTLLPETVSARRTCYPINPSAPVSRMESPFCRGKCMALLAVAAVVVFFKTDTPPAPWHDRTIVAFCYRTAHNRCVTGFLWEGKISLLKLRLRFVRYVARCRTVGPVKKIARLEEISSSHDYFLAWLMKSAVASASNHGWPTVFFM